MAAAVDIVWSISLITLWTVVLVNLLLTVRVIRFLQGVEELRGRQSEMEATPELPIGAHAPEFRARMLSGEPVRLSHFAGHAVAFIFLSPNCDTCRSKVPALVRLGPLAKERANVHLVLVSIEGAAETHSWIRTIQEEDKMELNLPVLVAPTNTSDFLIAYNPRNFVPYYCYIDEEGIVKARGHVDESEWSELEHEWGGYSPNAPSRSLRHFW
jgi:hypothetical protein